MGSQDAGGSVHTFVSWLGHAAKDCLGPAYRPLRRAQLWTEYHLRRPQPDSRIEQDAQSFWNQDRATVLAYSHWRGAGIFSDEERWLAWGKQHLALYEQFARMLGVTAPPQRVVDWGCGGGANAVHFAPLAQQYFGVEISEASLRECSRQLANSGLSNFVPLLISATDPEEARSLIPQPCDLFLCLGVFEILPTPEYGLRVLALAHDLLAEGGMAFIQIRYMGDSWETKPKRFGYRNFIGSMTSYRIDEFWIAAERCGFTPKAVTLVPYEPVNNQTNYAYFLLVK